MAATSHGDRRRPALLARISAILVTGGALGMLGGLAGPGWLFVGGLGAAGLGAVLLKFGEPADWWPGLLIRGS